MKPNLVTKLPKITRAQQEAIVKAFNIRVGNRIKPSMKGALSYFLFRILECHYIKISNGGVELLKLRGHRKDCFSCVHLNKQKMEGALLFRCLYWKNNPVIKGIQTKEEKYLKPERCFYYIEKKGA